MGYPTINEPSNHVRYRHSGGYIMLGRNLNPSVTYPTHGRMYFSDRRFRDGGHVLKQNPHGCFTGKKVSEYLDVPL
jgi:hypothetical protein